MVTNIDKQIAKAIEQYGELLESKKDLKIANHMNESLLEQVEWQNNFINFIKKNYYNRYDEACKYANQIDSE
jgi:2',3'-cyclic-nucleotide 2'-phosphodiesterase (5'-nucleotidase family)